MEAFSERKKVMCVDCEHVTKKTKRTVGFWWAGLVTTIAIFIVSQIFIYGKITGEIETHITNDPTHREMTEEFVTEKELEPRLKSLEDMVKFLYEKNGGK